MTTHIGARPKWRARAVAGTTLGALAIAAGMAAIPAQAADAPAAAQAVQNASFSWSVNPESGGGAFFGGCNFLVAGAAGDSGSSRLWTEADGFYKTTDGNVTITSPNAAGEQVAPTWATKCLGADGKPVTTRADSSTHNQVNFSKGVGTVNPATGTADIAFKGSFTIVYYGGLTYWTITDPKLHLEGGKGTLKGTASGYGADMYDTTKWVKLDPTEIVMADLSDVKLSNTGFTAQPTYTHVAVEPKLIEGAASSPQVRKDDPVKGPWGSFPASWIDFNILTGQGSYWYTSGGQVDARKPAAPVTFGYTLAAATPGDQTPGDQTPGDGDKAPTPGDKTPGDGDKTPGDKTPGNDGNTKTGDVTVSIPQAQKPEPPVAPTGSLEWTWSDTNENSAVALLGTAKQQGNDFVASGTLDTININDTRTGDAKGWEISATVGDFTSGSNTFSSSYLGWTPKVVSGEGVTPGAKAAPGDAKDAGLAMKHTLAQSKTAKTGSVNAELELKVPMSKAPAGDYTAQMTITALS